MAACSHTGWPCTACGFGAADPRAFLLAYREKGEVAELRRRAEAAELEVAQLKRDREAIAAKCREYSNAAVTSADTCVKTLERIQEMDVVVKAAQDWRRVVYPTARAWQDGRVRICDAALVRDIDAYTALEKKRS